MLTFFESLACCLSKDPREVGRGSQPNPLGGKQGRKTKELEFTADGIASLLQVANPKLCETFRNAESLFLPAKLTQWQLRWCTPENVERYLRGRDGNTEKAAVIFAQSLRWREEYREVLSGARVPRWQTDIRVLERGCNGHPIIYACSRYSVHTTGSNLTDMVEHIACVLDASIREMRGSASQVDVVFDTHGYNTAHDLNPLSLVVLARAARMVNQPYRDRLRTAIIVDAPATFQMVWRAIKPMLRETTRRKCHIVSREEAIKLIAVANGAAAADGIDRVMELNRTREGCRPTQFPSEIADRDNFDLPLNAVKATKPNFGKHQNRSSLGGKRRPPQQRPPQQQRRMTLSRILGCNCRATYGSAVQ